MNNEAYLEHWIICYCLHYRQKYSILKIQLIFRGSRFAPYFGVEYRTELTVKLRPHSCDMSTRADKRRDVTNER